MKKVIFIITIITGLAVTLFYLFRDCNAQQENFPVLKGPYLGQKSPGLTPELFAPGIVSTGKNELNAVFSPDGKEFYFSVLQQSGKYTIMFMKRENNLWTTPQIAPFSGKYSEADPFISHDGKKLYFCSSRPSKDNEKPKENYEIWVTKKLSHGAWAQPINPGPPVNSDRFQVHPTLTKDGTLYFTSDRDDALGSRDIYRSKCIKGEFSQIENLGNSVNSIYDEHDAFIAADESYILFDSRERPEGYGSGDLYISFRDADNTWTKAINLGPLFNTAALEYCPMVSPDGKYFFFTREMDGNGDIYWVDAKFIVMLKDKMGIGKNN